MGMRYVVKIKFLIAFSLFLFSFAKGQPHPILDDFMAYVNDEKVILKWTISSGSTCNGIRIDRSDDTVSFMQLGFISGVCGSNTSAVSYEYLDTSPIPNKINYYRLELGTQGFSDFVSIEYIKLSSGNYVVRPNPVVDEATIYFRNNSHLPMKFNLINISGNTVMTKENITGNSFLFNRKGLNSGLYIFTIQYNGNVNVKGKINL